MITIAVGGFHEQKISIVDHFGVPDDQLIGTSQISGENQLLGLSVFLHPQLDESRSQDMTGVMILGPDSRCWLKHDIIVRRLEERNRSQGIFLII